MIAALVLALALTLPVGSADTDIRYAAPRPAPDEWSTDIVLGADPLGEPRFSVQGRTGAPSEESRLLSAATAVGGRAFRFVGAPLDGVGSVAPAGGGAAPQTHIGTPALGFRGWATWLEWPGRTAAAGPVLRQAGIKPGDLVTVRYGSRFVVVRIIPGGCWCPPRRGRPVLLDLSLSAFRKLADPGRGVIAVTVETGIPRVAAPRSDTAP